MKNAIERFCKEKEHGLFLLDMPTGFGKTYHALQFIADNYDKDFYKDKKFFFVTTLKKNLPEKELREEFIKRNKEQDFNNLFINLKSNADFVIENLLDNFEDIPEQIKQKEEVRNLRWNVDQYIKSKTKYGDDTIFCKQLEEIIRDKTESKFRAIIINYLSAFKTPAEKLKAIENDKSYAWIGKIYPAVFSKEKRIFFMSVDKFILGNTTIIEPTYSFYTNEIIKDAVIFFDEFDSTKENVLNQIINAGLKNCIDYISLFKHIHSSLSTRDYPEILSRDSQKQQEYIKNNIKRRVKTASERLEKFNEIFQEIYNQFNLQFSLKTSQKISSENQRNFLFNDYKYHTVFSEQNSFIEIKTDIKEKVNWLTFTKKIPSSKDEGILTLISKIKGAITYFQNGCRIISYNYLHNTSENAENSDDKISLENAITTTLHEFNLPEKFIAYLKPIILSGKVTNPITIESKTQKEKIDLNYFNKSVYGNGFRYYDFEDSPEYNTQSRILLYDFPNTPERILLQVCDRARVIGISATATMDTAIINYDINYLKRMLGDDYYEMSEQEKENLQNDFNEYIKYYDKVKIKTSLVTCDTDEYEKELIEIFGDNEVAKRFLEVINRKFYDDNKNYYKGKFLKVVKVLKSFIENNSVKSFLCMTNSLAKEDALSLDLKLLKEIAGIIIKNTKQNLDAEKLLVVLETVNFENKLSELKKRLSDGEKIFVMSSYNSVGAGQNLQYGIPKNLEVIQINDRNKKSEKDFDCIYLENPTHILVNIKSGIEVADVIKSIFQTEFLMDRGEISINVGENDIKNAFKAISGGYAKTNRNGLYDTPSVENAAIRTLIQAVGRICRTGNKSNEINIFVDDDCLKYDFSNARSRLLNPEFKTLIDYCEKYKIQRNENNPNEIFENKATILSAHHMKTIDNIRKGFDREVNRKAWKDLRKMLLQYPTISQEIIDRTDNKEKTKFLYIEAPNEISSYSYEQIDDYRGDIKIKFDNSLPQKVSDSDIKLKEVLDGIPGLKNFFKENKYAMNFKPNKFLLTPVLFNNIYKGALGEAIGKFVLEKRCNINLLEMDIDCFELFDYKTENNVLIDFKYWKDTDEVSDEDTKAEIYDKLKKCKCEKAIIVNILSEKEFSYSETNDGKILEIPYLYRLDKHELDITMLEKIRSFINGKTDNK